MSKIIWSKRALKDIEAIYDFTALDSLHFTRKTLGKIIHRVKRLTEYLDLGKEVSEF